MDSSQLLDSFRDPYARRQAPSMALSTSLSSGQPYYTVESLEGASSLPLLKPSFTTSAPLPSERDALLRLDAQTRALLADRETIDARARLLAAEREALLRRNVPGAPVTDRRAYTDGLPPVDGRTRLDGLPPVDVRTRLDGLPPVDARTRLDGLPPVDARTSLDPRARSHGLDVRPPDTLRAALDDRARTLAPMVGLPFGAQDHRPFSEMVRPRELAAGARSGAAHFLPPTDYSHGRRDTADVRAPAMALDSSLTRRDVASRPASSNFRPQSERPVRFSKQGPAAVRSAPSEAFKKQSKGAPTTEKTLPVKLKTKPPPGQSEGWCAVCKIDCHNTKTLGIHLSGKKHKAMVEGKPVEGNDTEGNRSNQAERKRASDSKPETSQTAKRPKTSAAATGNGAPSVVTPDTKKGKGNDSKKDKPKTWVAKNAMDNYSLPGAATADATDSKKGKGDDYNKAKVKVQATKNVKDNPLVCEVCNISTTGQKNLESHLKGKRHAARVKELANS